MAIIGNNPDTLLRGLSDFWHTFFQDLGDIQALYEGTEMLFGQHYLDLLNSVLNVSVLETPIFRKEFYKLLTIREDQIVYVDNGVYGDNAYVFTPAEILADLPQLQNKVYSPTAAMEKGVEYQLINGLVEFIEDPTFPSVTGFASRSLNVAISGFFTDPTVPDFTALGINKGDLLYINPALPVDITTPSEGTVALTIVKVEPSRLTISTATPLPVYPVGATPSGYSWYVQRSRTDKTTATFGLTLGFTGVTVLANSAVMNEVSFWAVDVQVDDETLYQNFGYLLGRPNQSTEVYRSFIRGLMQLYVYGPAIDRLESALNVTANLQIVRDDGEVLISYDSGVSQMGVDATVGSGQFYSPTAVLAPEHVGSYMIIKKADHSVNIQTFRIVGIINANTAQLDTTTPVVDANATWDLSPTNQQVVTTNSQTYNFPIDIPIREDVADPTNAGVLTFRAFEVLTRAVLVTDYVKDASWWHDITIPLSLYPGRPSPTDRLATPEVLPNVVGPAGGYYVGDPGFYVGADEDGVLPEDGGSMFHHRAAFLVMDKLLKLHMFSIQLDPSIDLTGLLINDITQLMQAVKPVGSAIYFKPLTAFTDAMHLSEVLEVFTTLALADEGLTRFANDYVVGTTWLVGDGWKFQLNPTTDGDLGGGSIVIGTGAGFMQVSVGGYDPGLLAVSPSATYTERPLYVNAH